jgi:nucleoside-diphosphate-sugar epimerase
MSEKKIIAVVGATGAQGGGLARAILADPAGGFAVRALTRQPEGDKARTLAAAGAEVVHADAYCVTNFWEHFSPSARSRRPGTWRAAARPPACST